MAAVVVVIALVGTGLLLIVVTNALPWEGRLLRYSPLPLGVGAIALAAALLVMEGMNAVGVEPWDPILWLPVGLFYLGIAAGGSGFLALGLALLLSRGRRAVLGFALLAGGLVIGLPILPFKIAGAASVAAGLIGVAVLAIRPELAHAGFDATRRPCAGLGDQPAAREGGNPP
jgi:hypothetical protein